MKMNAPGAPPPHRLPVLTEVVRLDPAAPAGDAEGEAWASEGVPAGESAVLATPVSVPVSSPSPASLPLPPFSTATAPVQAFGHDGPAPPTWLHRQSAPPRGALPLPAMAPPSPLPPDFSGSWWSRDEGPAVTASVPVAVPLPPPPRPAAVPVSEQVLVARVLEGLGGQVDLMFDHRMREAVAPALARAADRLLDDLKQQLAVTLHEMVSRAVAVELARERERAAGEP